MFYYASFITSPRSAFTLIELSIVLVIIGLIVGGALVGQDLIEASKIRATISQVEKYNTATTTFRLKYNCLPGDCRNAELFGFPARGQYAGQGDGNKMIQGVWGNGAGNSGPGYQYLGETALFWVDLSQAGLIDQAFTIASATVNNASGNMQDDFFPKSKLGNSHVNIWGDKPNPWHYLKSNANYFQISKLPALVSSASTLSAEVGLTVVQAYSIDTKIDDGNPRDGNVGALYYLTTNATGSPNAGTSTASTCFKTSGGVSYSMDVDGGSNANCAITIKAGF